MCGCLAVVDAGRNVEVIMVGQLREGRAEQAYTAQLLRASLGYDREAARELVTYD